MVSGAACCYLLRILLLMPLDGAREAPGNALGRSQARLRNQYAGFIGGAGWFTGPRLLNLTTWSRRCSDDLVLQDIEYTSVNQCYLHPGKLYSVLHLKWAQVSVRANFPPLETCKRIGMLDEHRISVRAHPQVRASMQG